MWFEQVLFFLAGIGALAGRARRGGPAQPVLLGARAGRAPARAGRAVPAAAAPSSWPPAQVVVYAGAVMVLYIFVVAYIGGSDEPLRPEGGAGQRVRAAVRRGDRRSSSASRSSGAGCRRSTRAAPTSRAGFGAPEEIGQLLLTDFLVPFEAASYLLLVAAVGAVVLARRRRGLEDMAAVARVARARARPRPRRRSR